MAIASQTKLWHTPPEIAAQLGVEPEKVRDWIERGELIAVNIAARTTGRPRWRISTEEFQHFLVRRRSGPKMTPIRRRRPLAVKEFI